MFQYPGQPSLADREALIYFYNLTVAFMLYGRILSNTNLIAYNKETTCSLLSDFTKMSKRRLDLLVMSNGKEETM